MAAAWHVATTAPRPGAGALAEAELKKQGYNYFNPKVRELRLRKGLMVEDCRPYLPGYIFVNFDPAEDRWQPINWTRGISSLIYAAPEKPARIRDEAMDVLLGLCGSGDVAEDRVDRGLYEVGRRVLVQLGWAKAEGPVKWVTKDRLGVLLEMFGTKRTVSVALSQVEPVA